MTLRKTPELFPFQASFVEETWAEASWAEFFEQGTGKSPVTIHTAVRLYLENRIDGVVVIAPNGVHRNWITDELPKHCAVAWRGLDWHSDRAKAQDRALEVLLFVEPTHAAHVTTDGRRDQELAWLAVTYEAISRTERGRAAVRAFKDRYPRFLLVIDEGKRVANPEADVTKRTAGLRQLASHARVLNGTPVAQSPLEVYSQMKLLDTQFWVRHGIGSYTSFCARFAVKRKIIVGGADDSASQREADEVKVKRWEPIVPHGATKEGVAAYEQLDLDALLDATAAAEASPASSAPRPVEATPTTGRTIEVIVGYRELDKLRAMIAPMSTRVTKESAGLNLPPKLYTRLEFDMTVEQRRVYDQLRREYMVELESGALVTAAIAMVRVLRLQQIACGYLPNPDDPENPKLFYNDDGKNPRLQLLADRLEDTPHQAIIWARFTHDVDSICRLLGPPSCARYDGQVPPRERDAGIDRFKAGKVQFVVAKAQSMGVGLTLTEAKSAFYYSNTFSYYERVQSEDRCHRVGQHNPVNYYDICAARSVDNKILKSLRECDDVASRVTGDKIREWFDA